MTENNVKLGPFALVLTVISVCLVVLAVLSLSTAAADRQVSEKFAETVYIRYALEKKGQAFLAEASDAYSEGRGLDTFEEAVLQADGSYEVTMEDNGYMLTMNLEEGDGIRVHSFSIERVWEEDKEPLNLWDGGK